MITRTVVIFLLITPGLLARNYLIEVANKRGDEGVDGADERAEGEGRKARKLQPGSNLFLNLNFIFVV